MMLTPVEINYCEIIAASYPPPLEHPPSSMALDIYSQSPWFGDADSPDPLREFFPSNEAIVETMSLEDLSWSDGHHRSSFMPGLGEMFDCIERFASQVPTPPLQTPILTHEVLSEGNLSNITQTMPIDISVKPRVVENIHVGVTCSPEEIQVYTNLFREFKDVFMWSYEEMPGIDPSIVMHEIPTYPGAKPVRQCLRPVHPRKAATIKAEVEKLLIAGFIYPIPIT